MSAGGGVGQEDRVGCEEVHALVRGIRLQGRRDLRRGEQVERDQLERLVEFGIRARLPLEMQLELEDGAGDRDPFRRRDDVENALVHQALGGPHLDVGVAVHGGDRVTERIERRGVDQVDRERQRDADGDCGYAGQRSPRLGAELGMAQPAQQRGRAAPLVAHHG